MPIISLEEALKLDPNLKLGWNIETTSQGKVCALDDSRFGRIEIAAMTNKDGKPIFDKIFITEGPKLADGTRALYSGAVIVPYFEEKGIYIGMMEQVRPVVIDPTTGKQGSYKSLEVPRGFGNLKEETASAAMRELGEETGKHAKSLNLIGRVNANNALFTTPGVPVYAAEIDESIQSHLKSDATELILKSKFMPREEVYDLIGSGKITCGFTLSALMFFDRYMANKH